ncbi:6-phosphogluconate dehydrogenase C-terminal domain-like protein [Hypoxylon trugodes]|uniref:6-phosphogluconate dehydrogenase C-terminal domain-like protein n=1 Tax=Hypoxylon trugodes TaxID=326681 RepID=UPI002197D667|nr:6-phosphogluconate dehydrogenase C-terminal domain-like protein [Hypoxylon trugodes]KAI1384864.1 6-phosphogluconate dehydrogenase C-terminal domain-like protein [Hypoxylon trugodes]
MNRLRRIGCAAIKTYNPRRSFRVMSYSTSSKQVPADWLRRVLENRSEPPRLYAWTLANLPNGTHSVDKSARENKAQGVGDERRRIYILGLGNLGRLYASFLAKNTPKPPITLVLHRKELLEHWRAHPGIELTRFGKVERNADFDIEWWTDAKPSVGPVREPNEINNLIVATKAADALPQVDRVRRYLGPGSTVAFTQNGMCKLWPPLGEAYVEARFAGGRSPKWLTCVTTHGVTSLGPFRSVHASPAGVSVGTVMRGDGQGGEYDTYLEGQLLSAPGLDAEVVGTRDLWVAQLEKLVVNAAMNPLTAVLWCKNGDLLAKEDGVVRVADLLIEEAGRVLRALVLHKGSEEILLAGRVDVDGGKSREERLEGIREELIERFSFEKLRTMLYDVAARVGENTSSMLQDVRAGKKTEIDDFNGWLVETAKYVGDGWTLPAHEKLITLVKDEASLTRDELSGHFLNR